MVFAVITGAVVAVLAVALAKLIGFLT